MKCSSLETVRPCWTDGRWALAFSPPPAAGGPGGRPAGRAGRRRLSVYSFRGMKATSRPEEKVLCVRGGDESQNNGDVVLRERTEAGFKTQKAEP